MASTIVAGRFRVEVEDDGRKGRRGYEILILFMVIQGSWWLIMPYFLGGSRCPWIPMICPTMGYPQISPPSIDHLDDIALSIFNLPLLLGADPIPYGFYVRTGDSRSKTQGFFFGCLFEDFQSLPIQDTDPYRPPSLATHSSTTCAVPFFKIHKMPCFGLAQKESSNSQTKSFFGANEMSWKEKPKQSLKKTKHKTPKSQR